MSWTIAGDWLAVAGLIFLTIGTAAQALGNLAEFKSLRRAVSKAASDALTGIRVNVNVGPLVVAVPIGLVISARKPRRLLIMRVPLLIFLLPAQLARIRAEGGEEAVQIAQFLRLAEVWTTIMIGSALGLAAAVVQLVLSY